MKAIIDIMNQPSSEVEVFKTDITKKKVARLLVESLAVQFPGYHINLDFDDCDKVLRIESLYPSECFQMDVDQIVSFVQHQNVKIELLS